MYTFKNELHTFRNDTILAVSKTKLKLKKKTMTRTIVRLQGVHVQV